MATPDVQEPTTANETLTAVTLPRSLDFYERQGDFFGSGRDGLLIDAISEGLRMVMLTPGRYAELMQIIDAWVVEDHTGGVDSHFEGVRTQHQQAAD